MSNRIFNTLPLGTLANSGALGDASKPASKSSTLSPARATQAQPAAKPTPRKSKAAIKVTEIPAPPSYRVESLARLNALDDKWRTKAMRSHRVPTLLWFTRGQGRMTVSGITRGFGPHNLIYMPTKTMYGFEPIGQISGFVVHLTEEDVRNLPPEPVHMRFMDVTQQNELTGLIEGLSREITTEQTGRRRAMALQAGLLSLWLERQISHMPEFEMTPDASRRLAAAFTALVEEQFRDGHSVSHYAAALGVTPTHLTRACNHANGHSASKILADRVHFEARRMLLETDLAVKDVAERLGFHSPAYFTRAFAKNTGQTPRDFRRTHIA